MSAVDIFRDALLGNPPSPTKEPSREGVLAGFMALHAEAVVAQYAAVAGITTVPTTAARDAFYATEANRGKLVYVNNQNGSATDPANGVYEYVNGAARFAQSFYAGIATVVQPVVDGAVVATQAQADRAEAAAARVESLAGKPARDLLGTDQGFAIDGNTDVTARAAAVIGGSKDYDGDLRAWLPTSVFPRPKLVVDKTGATVWSPHNMIYASATLNAGSDWTKSAITVADGVASPAGSIASKLTATNAAARVSQGVAIGSGSVGDPLTCAVIASMGTGSTAGRYLVLGIEGTRAYFDLSSGTVSSTSGAATATISRTDADGRSLPTGEYLCSISSTWTDGEATFSIGLVDAPGSDAATSGLNLFVRQPRASRGTKALPYLARGGFPAAMPVGIPYDWSMGERRILIDADDDFRLTTALFPTPTTLFVDGDVVPIGSNVHQIVEFINTGDGNQYASIQQDTTQNPTLLTGLQYVPSGSRNPLLGAKPDMASSTRLSLSIRLSAGATTFCVNGDIAGLADTPLPTINAIQLGGNPSQAPTHRLYLRSLKAIARVPTTAEQAAWQDGQRYNPAVRSSDLIAAYAQDANTTNIREPVVILLGETPARAMLLVLVMQKHDTGHHGEAPARILYTRYDVLRDGTLVRLASGVLYQPAGFANGLGHSQSPCSAKIKVGSKRGETVVWISVLATANQTFTPTEERTIYVMRSKDNGLTWSNPVAALTTAAVPGAAYLVLDPSGRMIEFPADSAYPGRLLSMVYSPVRALYSDDGGDTIVAGGAMPAISAYAPNEASCALLPGGRIVAMMRVARTSDGTEPDDIRYAAISSDGGATWGTPFQMPGFSGAQVAGSAIQVDPQGERGSVGLIAQAHALGGVFKRNGNQIDLYSSTTLAIRASILAVPRARYSGYSSLVSLWGGEWLVLGAEHTPTQGFNQWSSGYLKVVKTDALP